MVLPCVNELGRLIAEISNSTFFSAWPSVGLRVNFSKSKDVPLVPASIGISIIPLSAEGEVVKSVP